MKSSTGDNNVKSDQPKKASNIMTVNLTKATNIPAVAATKADAARAVFAAAYPDGKTTTMQRKDIIAKMVEDAKLTKAGAATYLQNMKKKAGIVASKAPAEAVPA